MDMKFRRFFLLTFFLVMTAVFSEDTVHILKKGETVYSLAQYYQVDVQTILKVNNISDPTKLQAGQKILIPTTNNAAIVPASNPSQTLVDHKVKKGETLYGIARHYEISLQTLRSVNNIPDNFILKEGFILKIPMNTVSPVEIRDPVIKPNEGPVLPPPDPRPTEPKNTDPSIQWPVAAKEIAYMTGKLSGVVIMGEKSEPVKSLTQGSVVSAGPYRGFGKVVIVQRTGGYLYVYGGCESLSVKEGDRVSKGMELGKLGIDPVSVKPQLFFLVHQNNLPLDPAKAPRN